LFFSGKGFERLAAHVFEALPGSFETFFCLERKEKEGVTAQTCLLENERSRRPQVAALRQVFVFDCSIGFKPVITLFNNLKEVGAVFEFSIRERSPEEPEALS